ncbi:helix-turn-helix domain-containing protein [Bosea sp. BIWAKO-01]|uniref:helix-turn-helix domain-containing protein n=1 Tax=Bosea sp. BIWAKO-01 TaxID=506668 RepID=UPI00086DAE13|nr:helix-turn-helix domain-containing protein [Bosea sp. BIWAKO-01]GAU80158.1 transcriptional regulator of Cro/CI family [Bosea sp. BIWAKO-01]
MKEPNRVDEYVGIRLRRMRRLTGYSQTKLAELLGITFQQIQKYEKGVNRISASRLQHIANIFQIPVAHFFEGAPVIPPPAADSTPEAPPPEVTDLLATRDGVRLAKAFASIRNLKTRRRIVALTEAMGDAAEACEAEQGRATGAGPGCD